MPEDEFELYLTLLAKTLRLSDEQRDAIAAELRDHMAARLRELTLQGVERQDAINTALAEFGDASALAKDLTKTNPARQQQRRHLMQTSFGTIAACAAVRSCAMGPAPGISARSARVLGSPALSMSSGPPTWLSARCSGQSCVCPAGTQRPMPCVRWKARDCCPKRCQFHPVIPSRSVPCTVSVAGGGGRSSS